MRGNVAPEHEALIRLIQDMIETTIEGRLCEVATIVAIGDGLITVRFDDEDDNRTVGFPRVYGVAYAVSDRVGMLATSSGEWVCVGPVGASVGNKSRRVTAAEIGIAAITAEGKHLAAAAVETAAIADDAVTAAKLQRSDNANTGAVTTGVIRDGAVTPVKLSQTYATPGLLGDVLSGSRRPNGDAIPTADQDPYQRQTQVKATANDAKADAKQAAANYTDGRLAGTIGDDGNPNAKPKKVLREGDVSTTFSAKSITHTTTGNQSSNVATELDLLWQYQRCIINRFNAGVAAANATGKGKNTALDKFCSQFLIP
jgi:hypothetical protein